MKSITLASEALPETSSLGMIKSPSTIKVCRSWSLKNEGRLCNSFNLSFSKSSNPVRSASPYSSFDGTAATALSFPVLQASSKTPALTVDKPIAFNDCLLFIIKYFFSVFGQGYIRQFAWKVQEWSMSDFCRPAVQMALHRLQTGFYNHAPGTIYSAQKF